ncbi:MAG TPA: NAD-dependent epimerase/dehydratase family protein, partial [Terriglobales bacterium]|nr:NAD-dependent epimerase/dehydratase family protein [Terriglobales bacterium]
DHLSLPSIRAEGLIHLAPLILLPPLLPRLEKLGVKRIIAFGSTSRFTKQNSSDPDERAFARDLAAAEETIAKFCAERSISWTIFRPTLIYGCGMDRNITIITKFIRQFGFFPLIGEGNGLRQPVHADDLASACMAVLDNPLIFNRAYDLSGGETLKYRKMVERIFQALGKPARFLRIPLPLFVGLMHIASLLPRYRFLSGEMVRRMNQDLCFDHAEASRDFDYSPRGFRPNAADLDRREFHAGISHLGRLPERG